jgi:hypothetical protein
MRPLIFLSTRSFVNAVRRALTSGKRLVTLIFALAYYGWLVFRPIGGGFSSRHPTAIQFARVDPTAIDAVVFAAFAVMSLLLTLTLITPRAGFRQADVDVLFATPVSPRLVMFFRMIRDYVWTLLSPFMLALFGGRAGFQALQSFLGGMHGQGPLVVRLAAAAWFLMAMAWVCIGYGISFFVNRSDLAADRNKKIIDTLLTLIIVGTLTFVIVHAVQQPQWSTAIAITQAPVIRIVLFTATASSWMVMGALNGNASPVAAGVAALLSVSIAGILMALSQLPYMYDQAAVKGFGSVERRMLQRNNDLYGLTAQRARDGKYRVGRLSAWIGKMRISGAAALIWKEVLFQLRASPVLYIFFGSILVMMMFPVVMLESDAAPSRVLTTGISLFFTQAIGVLMLTMNSAISGYIELLKRVDFQKPLPFKPAGIVFWEVASKCIPNIVVAGFASILVIALRPVLWNFAIASEALVVGLSLLVSATVFLVTIAFPDAGDASQRGFRGILILLGTFIFALPGFGAMALLLGMMHTDPLLAVIPATVINIGIALVVSFFAGGLYAAYNPSE